MKTLTRDYVQRESSRAFFGSTPALLSGYIFHKYSYAIKELLIAYDTLSALAETKLEL